MTGASPPRQAAGRSGLLLVLISAYVFSAFNGRKLAVDLQIALFAAVALLALRSSLLPGRWPVLVGALTLLGSATASGASTASCPWLTAARRSAARGSSG